MKSLLLVALSLLSSITLAATTVASASNFKPTLDVLLEQSNVSGLNVVAASTGKLTAQINRGAPFDLFLSADTIGKKIDTDKIVAGSEFTYAFGQLALVSSESINLDSPKQLRCIAIANPRVAPYGRAAFDSLRNLEQQGWIFDRVIQGQSVAQAFQFFDSGACNNALAAYAQVLAHSKDAHHILIPSDWHSPIRQNAVLLKSGSDKAPAKQFFEFLKSTTARKIIRDAGYLLEAK